MAGERGQGLLKRRGTPRSSRTFWCGSCSSAGSRFVVRSNSPGLPRSFRWGSQCLINSLSEIARIISCVRKIQR
jgi:hypothetical protein